MIPRMILAAIALAILPRPIVAAEFGLASWYGPGFHGRMTASGAPYDPARLTCAHRTIRFGLRVHVRNPANGRIVTCLINDRGPFVPGRDIDLSRAAAERLGMIGAGTAWVTLKIRKRAP